MSEDGDRRRDTLDETSPEQFGPNFDLLAIVVRDELLAQIGVGRLGAIEIPSPEALMVTVVLIADGIDDVFSIEPRSPVQPLPDEERAALDAHKSRIRRYVRPPDALSLLSPEARRRLPAAAGQDLAEVTAHLSLLPDWASTSCRSQRILRPAGSVDR